MVTIVNAMYRVSMRYIIMYVPYVRMYLHQAVSYMCIGTYNQCMMKVHKPVQFKLRDT